MRQRCNNPSMAAAELRERTLTNLYNQRPQWLVHAHRNLDAAVAAWTRTSGTATATTRRHDFSAIWQGPRRFERLALFCMMRHMWAFERTWSHFGTMIGYSW
jgi:hypothetical protein